MVHTMHEEVESEECGHIRQQTVNVEQEAVEPIFQECPNQVAQEETGKG